MPNPSQWPPHHHASILWPATWKGLRGRQAKPSINASVSWSIWSASSRWNFATMNFGCQNTHRKGAATKFLKNKKKHQAINMKRSTWRSISPPNLICLCVWPSWTRLFHGLPKLPNMSIGIYLHLVKSFMFVRRMCLLPWFLNWWRRNILRTLAIFWRAHE